MTSSPIHNGRVHHPEGTLDPALLTTQRGVRAIQWSLLILATTAILQLVIVLFSESTALLVDTIHNFADAATAFPLWLAFVLAQRKPSPRFPYGYGRVEDVAGIIIVLFILLSAFLAGYESVDRLLNPRPVHHLVAVVVASLIGFAGNELVAILRIRVGKEIKSDTLVSDGYHARVDALTSLGVLLGALGVWLGYPLADPLVGLLITPVILGIAWKSGKMVFTRLADGVDPEVISSIRQTVKYTQGVHEVTNVRARWLGHRLNAEVNLAVAPELSVAEAHTIAVEVIHHLLHHLPYLSNVTVHVDPLGQSGEEHHRVSREGLK